MAQDLSNFSKYASHGLVSNPEADADVGDYHDLGEAIITETDIRGAKSDILRYAIDLIFLGKLSV
jgi:hypothetical protein